MCTYIDSQLPKKNNYYPHEVSAPSPNVPKLCGSGGRTYQKFY